MVGFLCSARKEKRFANHLRKIMMRSLKEQNIYILVFTMSNMNLIDKTVFGSLITKNSITRLRTIIPSTIFNFSVQYAKSDFKKLMDLMEVENLSLINSSNSFNQWTIMKMLTSDLKTRQYIMPFVNITKEATTFNFSKTRNFIVKPQNGTKLSKTIYCRKTYTGYDLYNWGETICSHLFSIENAIMPTIRTGKWILSISPELTTYNNRLYVLRSYLQKGNDGEWKVVLKSEVPQTKKVNKKTDDKIDDSLLQIIRYVNCFILDLHFCSIDLVFSKDGLPYFLNLSGWQNLTPGEPQDEILFQSLCRNMMAYADISK